MKKRTEKPAKTGSSKWITPFPSENFSEDDEGLAPTREEIPEEFFQRENEYNKRSRALFFRGGHIGTFRPDIDGSDAVFHLQRLLMTFSIAHEHKIAAAAYLLSLWTES